ncbi:related to SSZ1 - regulator protein involved in pleiotropic drug resistance [Ustilago trichophora]|uniref:Related to SSZ1 - regulator protein involved in pleiotropic drug resistance n=1 Tax=Ustilago trichophora TaxID=86804 RepID=A0A5C3EK13_9BASI|nr:related to SSZ1 - regulator protein involved in pleiotropic drug resistance [Ustilago trichophora]
MTEAAGAVIGINFGHSYSSIACINQHGRADVIANEDGERQLATRIAFNGDQVYLANQATPQLVRNAPNVIDNFVNLLGRSFSDLSADEKKRASAAVIDVNGAPGFKVEIDGAETTLTVHDVSVRFLRSLFLTAKDFLSGVPIAGAVLSVPQWFPAAQITALKKAAEEAGLIVLQIIPASAAALAAYGLTSPAGHGALPAHPDGVDSAPYPIAKALDRNVVVVDMGGSSTDVTVLSARSGLYTVLSYLHDATVGGTTLDSALVAFFAKEFTKKTKITIAETDKRAWAKLRNEAEFTKRALSASNSATCSVESLAEGVDFTGSVNRMRFDMLAGAAYGKVVAGVEKALKEAGLEACQVDEVVLAGGSARLSGLADRLAGLFGDAEQGGAHITASIDADQVIARGCAIQAQVIAAAPEGSKEAEYIHNVPAAPVTSVAEFKVQTTSAPLGLVLADKFVTLIPAHTPFPVRRSYRFPVAKGADSVAFVLDEGVDEVKTETIQPEEEDLDEDEEPMEPEVVKTAVTKAAAKNIASFAVPTPSKGGKKVELELLITKPGSLIVEAREEGAEGVKLAL